MSLTASNADIRNSSLGILTIVKLLPNRMGYHQDAAYPRSCTFPMVGLKRDEDL